MNPRINILQGDITKLRIDAIVNAANSSLLGGGGVDGAIHRAAGPELLHACRLLGGCKTGEAVITPGFDLPAEYIIHTVGPVWNGGAHQEDELLASCYEKSLDLAVANDINTLAFPAISTGIYGFPFERATKIAIKTIDNFLATGPHIHQVTLVCFDERDYREMQRIAEEAD